MKKKEEERKPPPKPISPLRALAFGPYVQRGRPANWTVWASMRTVQLWQAVALSLGLEPESLPGPASEYFHDFAGCPPEFLARLKIAKNHSGHSLPRETTTPVVWGDSVTLAAFAKWARSLTPPWAMPKELAELPEPMDAKRAAKKPKNAPLADRERTTYYNTIAGLLELMLGKTPAGNSGSVYETQASIIAALEAHFPDRDGLAKSTLEKTFAEAKRSLAP